MSMRYRFVVGRERTPNGTITSAVGERTRSYAAAVAKSVAVNAAEESFNRIRREIASSFERDAKRELTYLMSLYRRHIIGANAKGARPTGMLGYVLASSDTGIGDDDREIAIASLLPSWAPRSPAYLARKTKLGQSQNWWSARGNLGGQLTASTLLQAYGPIRVSVIRNRAATDRVGSSPGSIPISKLNVPGEETKVRVNVATVRIFAMEQITPSMLPGLATGNLEKVDDDPGRGRRLIAPLKGVAPDAAYKLGRLSYRTQRYRPTLDPFLTWFLTRSIPNALALRIEEGLVGRSRKIIKR